VRWLHHRDHAVRVARVEPERLFEQLWVRRQHALAGGFDVVREPALGHEEAHELFGCLHVAAVLENRGGEDTAPDEELLTARLSGHTTVAVFS
jgi:hypothetical protein